MEEPISSPTVQPQTSSSLPVKLWTPSLIGWVTFLLGFPGGIVLASINWIRMGMREKAIMHLAAGAAGMLLLIYLALFSSSSSASFPTLLINLGIIYYLSGQMKFDIAVFGSKGGNVQEANGWGGCLIGVASLLVFIGIMLVIVFTLVLFNVPLPE